MGEHGQHRILVRCAILLAGLAVCGHSAQACRLALVLALDVSNSVDADEDALQRNGLATALLAPAVRDAFFASDAPVALAVFEWSGRHHQRMMQDWVLIDTPATLEIVADKIATTPRFYYEFPTAIGYALGFSAGLLDTAPQCDAQTIDVSGDGVNNDGFEPRDAFLAFDLEGVTINGLVIEDAALRAGQIDLTTYYLQNVIQGPGAFIEVARGFDDFARAMEIKLVRELGVLMLGQNTLLAVGQDG